MQTAVNEAQSAELPLANHPQVQQLAHYLASSLLIGRPCASESVWDSLRVPSARIALAHLHILDLSNEGIGIHAADSAAFADRLASLDLAGLLVLRLHGNSLRGDKLSFRCSTEAMGAGTARGVRLPLLADLQLCNAVGFGRTGAASLRHLTGLTCLDISRIRTRAPARVQVPQGETPVATSLAELQQLRRLCMNFADLDATDGDRVAEQFASGPALTNPQLEHLEWRSEGAGHDARSRAIIACVPHSLCTQLTHLDLSAEGFMTLPADADGADPPALPFQALGAQTLRLQDLRLGGRRVGAAHMCAVLLRCAASLQHLDVSATDLNEAAVSMMLNPGASVALHTVKVAVPDGTALSDLVRQLMHRQHNDRRNLYVSCRLVTMVASGIDVSSVGSRPAPRSSSYSSSFRPGHRMQDAQSMNSYIAAALWEWIPPEQTSPRFPHLLR